LNVHILAGNAARQWHADSGKPRTFILYEKNHEWVCSNASTSLNNPLLVRVWPMWLSVKLYLRTGPVLSRFDRFLPIGPRAEGDPALRLLTNANLHFLLKLLLDSAGVGPSVFYVERRKRLSNFFNGLAKYSINSL